MVLTSAKLVSKPRFNEAMGYEAKKVRCGKQRAVRGLWKLPEGLPHGSDPRV